MRSFSHLKLYKNLSIILRGKRGILLLLYIRTMNSLSCDVLLLRPLSIPDSQMDFQFFTQSLGLFCLKLLRTLGRFWRCKICSKPWENKGFSVKNFSKILVGRHIITCNGYFRNKARASLMISLPFFSYKLPFHVNGYFASMDICISCVCMVPEETKRGCWIPWN